jgi:hypothetical protein
VSFYPEDTISIDDSMRNEIFMDPNRHLMLTSRHPYHKATADFSVYPSSVPVQEKKLSRSLADIHLPVTIVCPYRMNGVFPFPV